MTDTASDATRTTPTVLDPSHYGVLGRLGLAVTRHRRMTLVVWALVVVGLGVFAPRVETELSGAGWQANGSESVAVRDLAVEHFGGNASSAIQVVVTDPKGDVLSGAGSEALAQATAILEADPRVGDVIQPQPGATVSQDGHTAVLLAGAGADTNEMVRVADDHKATLQDLGVDGVTVQPTGASVLWSDFNKANLDAMLTSEMFSWPVTLAILVLAFGALLAAGLPLVLTLAGLVASAGSLVLINHLVPVSIWAMNFAMMFALALGIDYALFIVQRFRAARLGSHEDAQQAIAETMDTAGKAVLLSGLTVLVSLSAVMLVPSPSFRSMAGGIMLAVVFVLAATLTLLPVVLSALDERVNWGSLPWVHTGEHRSARFAAWGERLWRRPVAFGAAAAVVLLVLAAPVVGLHTAMPSIKVLPTDSSARVGYDTVQAQFGPGAPGTLQVVADADQADQTDRRPEGRHGHRRRHAGPAGRRRQRAGPGLRRPDRRPLRPRPRHHRRPAPRRPALLRAGRRRSRGEPRPQGPARRLHPAGDHRRTAARLPPAPHRPPGAAHRLPRHPGQPALDRRRLRRGPPGLPGRLGRRASSASSPKASSTPGRRSSSSR